MIWLRQIATYPTVCSSAHALQCSELSIAQRDGTLMLDTLSIAVTDLTAALRPTPAPARAYTKSVSLPFETLGFVQHTIWGLHGS